MFMRHQKVVTTFFYLGHKQDTLEGGECSIHWSETHDYEGASPTFFCPRAQWKLTADEYMVALQCASRPGQHLKRKLTLIVYRSMARRRLKSQGTHTVDRTNCKNLTSLDKVRRCCLPSQFFGLYKNISVCDILQTSYKAFLHIIFQTYCWWRLKSFGLPDI